MKKVNVKDLYSNDELRRQHDFVAHVDSSLAVNIDTATDDELRTICSAYKYYVAKEKASKIDNVESILGIPFSRLKSYNETDNVDRLILLDAIKAIENA